MTPLIHVCAAAEEDRAEFMLDAGRPHPESHAHNQLICTLVLIHSCCATLFCGSSDMSSTCFASSGDRAVAGVSGGGYRHHQMISLSLLAGERKWKWKKTAVARH